ncbi:MAG: c-type cytochrome [Gallionellaceae bacterium]|nr:c-type cytochrome [Gallionellaceae bacterium]
MKTHALIVSLSLILAACGQEQPAESTAPAAPAAVPAEPVAPPQEALGAAESAPAPAPATEAAPTPAPAPVVAPAAAPAPAPVAAPAPAGQALYAAKCQSCHGKNREGLAGNPKLAGLSKADMASRLKDYRAGKQMGPKTAIMAAMAKPLTDVQIDALADYLGE